jgi:hypothetical protein
MAVSMAVSMEISKADPWAASRAVERAASWDGSRAAPKGVWRAAYSVAPWDVLTAGLWAVQ